MLFNLKGTPGWSADPGEPPPPLSPVAVLPQIVHQCLRDSPQVTLRSESCARSFVRASAPRAAAASAGWTWRPGSPAGSCTGPSAEWSPRSSPRLAGTWSRSPSPPSWPPWSTRIYPSAPRSPPSSCWRSGAPWLCPRPRRRRDAAGGRVAWAAAAARRPRSGRSVSSSRAAAARRSVSPADPPWTLSSRFPACLPGRLGAPALRGCFTDWTRVLLPSRWKAWDAACDCGSKKRWL